MHRALRVPEEKHSASSARTRLAAPLPCIVVRRAEFTNRNAHLCLAREYLWVEMRPPALLCQGNQCLQQLLRLGILPTGVQHACQDERTRNLERLLCMVLANFSNILLAKLKRLRCLLFCCLQLIPLIEERGKVDQCAPPVKRVLPSLGEHLSIETGRLVQLPLPGGRFA